MSGFIWELDRRPGETNDTLSHRVANVAALAIADGGVHPSTLFLLAAEAFSQAQSAVRRRKRFWASSAAPKDIRGLRLAEVSFGDPSQDRWAGLLQVDPDATVAALEFLLTNTCALAVLGAPGHRDDGELQRLLMSAFDNDEGRGVNWSAAVGDALEADLSVARAFGEFDDRSFGIEVFDAVPDWLSRFDVGRRRSG